MCAQLTLDSTVSMLSFQPCLPAKGYSWIFLPFRAARCSNNVKGFEEVHILTPWRFMQSWVTLGPKQPLLRNLDIAPAGV